jgi:hypothetical protein
MRETLAEELEAVREELRRAGSADPGLLGMLGRVVHDVTTLTDEDIATRRESLGERLEEQAALFESEHPRLAGALRRLIRALADLGI